MSKRNESFDLTTNDPKKVIEVKVRYSKPDGSYHDPHAEQQGYWIGMTPVEIDGVFRTTVAYTGLKRFLEPAKRFGAKKLETLMIHAKHEILVGHTEDSLVQMALRVAEENGLTITQWTKGG
jgi:hypothetical protein